jgi:hypothetical protein
LISRYSICLRPSTISANGSRFRVVVMVSISLPESDLCT